MNNALRNITTLAVCAFSVATSNVHALNGRTLEGRAANDAKKCVEWIVEKPWDAEKKYLSLTRGRESYFRCSELNTPVKKFADTVAALKIKDQKQYDSRSIIKALHTLLTELQTLPVGKNKLYNTVLVSNEYKKSLHDELLKLYNLKLEALKKNPVKKQNIIKKKKKGWW